MKFANKLLSEVAFFQEGPGVRKFQFRNEGVKLLNVGNINKGVLDTSTTKLYISEEEAYGKYKHFLVDEGDLLIASSGIVVENFHNKIAYVKKEHLPLCLNTSTIRFKTLDEKVFSLDYLKFYLKTTHFKNQLKKLITGAAQLNFGPSHLKKITLPVPSLPDQIHIANILSKAENLIAQRKESIRLLDEFLKSTFLEMFGDLFIEQKDCYQKIGEVCNFIDYRGKTLERVEQGVFYISAKCVRKGYFDFERIDYITQESYEKVMTRGFPKPNDVLFTTEGATMGFVCRIPRSLTKEFAVGQRLITLQPNEKLKSEYLDFVLNHNEIQKQIFKRSSGSAAIGIRSAEFSEIKIPIASLSLQTQFAQIVEKTEALKTQYQQSLQELENLYGSLSQKAFRGELNIKQAAV